MVWREMSKGNVEIKILVTVEGAAVAGRFDMVSETVVATFRNGRMQGEPKIFLVSQPSAEELCQLILKEEVGLLICGGIEERHHKFLTWKGVRVLDGVIGPADTAMTLAAGGELEPGVILPGPVA